MPNTPTSGTPTADHKPLVLYHNPYWIIPTTMPFNKPAYIVQNKERLRNVDTARIQGTTTHPIHNLKVKGWNPGNPRRIQQANDQINKYIFHNTDATLTQEWAPTTHDDFHTVTYYGLSIHLHNNIFQPIQHDDIYYTISFAPETPNTKIRMARPHSTSKTTPPSTRRTNHHRLHHHSHGQQQSKPQPNHTNTNGKLPTHNTQHTTTTHRTRRLQPIHKTHARLPMPTPIPTPI